jgi:DamX protein
LASAFTTTIGDGDALDLLGRRFEDIRREGRLPVIIIDDAHLLPELSIITLLQLYTRLPEDRPMVRILLFAQPEIDAILESPQIQSIGVSVLQTLDMPLFKREQTFAYIDHILEAENSSSSLRLSAAQSEKIHTDSGGLPGRVEQLVQESLHSGIVQWGAARLSNVSPLTTVATIIGVVALLLILIFQDSINSLFGEPEEVELQAELPSEGEVSLTLPSVPPVELPEATTSPSEVATEPLVTAAIPELPEADQPVDKPALPNSTQDVGDGEQAESVSTVEPPVSRAEEGPAETVVVAEPEPVKELEQQEPAAPADEKVTTEPVVVEESAPSPISPPDVVQSQQQAAEPEQVEAAEPADETTASEVVPTEEIVAVETVDVQPEEGAPVEEVIPVASVEDETSSTPSPQEVAPQPPEEPAAPKPAPVRDATPKKPKVEQQAKSAGVKQEAWLLKQSPEDYTLQLIGLRDAQGIPRFIKRHSLNGQAAYFRTSHQGQPWFVVLYGVYPNRSAAVKARSTLPPKLRSTGVWPRSFGDVQKEIRNR